MADILKRLSYTPLVTNELCPKFIEEIEDCWWIPRAAGWPV